MYLSRAAHVVHGMTSRAKRSAMFTLACLGVLIVFWQAWPMTEERATAIAGRALLEIARSERIDISQFNLVSVNQASEGPLPKRTFDFGYVAAGPPKLSVVIYVYPNGRTEIAQMYD